MLTAKVKFGVVMLLAPCAALLGGGTLAGQGSEGAKRAPKAAPILPPVENTPPKGGGAAVKPASGLASADGSGPPFASARIGTTCFRFPGQGMIAACPDGRRALVFRPNDHEPARLVDLTTEHTIRAYHGLPPANGHRGLAIVGEDRAAYCDNSNDLCIFDLKTGKLVQRCDKVMKPGSETHPIAVSADGRRVAVASGVRWATGKYEGQVLVYDVMAAKVVADVHIDGFDVRCAALSADGKRFAVLGVGVDPQGNAKRVDLIEVREVESGKTVCRMERSVQGGAIPARFSPDGKYLAVSMWPGVEVWDATTGRSLWREQRQATALRFTPDSRHLYGASSSGEVRVWDAATGKAASTRELPGASDVGAGPIGEMVFTPDNRLLGFGWRGVVLSVWDMKAGKLLAPADGFTWPVTAVRFTPDGQELVAATDALHVARAEARTGRIIARIDPKKLTDEQRSDPILSTHPSHMAAVALSPDARLLAYPTRSQHLGMIDLAAGRVLWTAPINKGAGHTFEVAPVFSLDGSKVSAGGYFEPYVEPGNHGSRSIVAWEPATGKQFPGWAPAIGPIQPGGGRHASVAFAPDGSKVAVLAEGPGLFAWDVVARQPLAKIGGAFGQWIAVGPENRTVVMTEKNHIVGRDLITGSITRSLDFCPEDLFPEFDRRGREPTYPPDRVGHYLACPFTFSPDGRLFAVGLVSSEIRVYEWAGFGHRFTLTGHGGPVRSLAFSPDGKLLASGSDDTTVLIWDLSQVWQAAFPKVLSTGESLWAQLIGQETGPAWEAMRELAARPEIAVPLIQERLKPAPALTVTEADIPALIKQLGAAAFPERERAAQGLRQLGHRAVPHLQQTMKNPPSLEMKRRAEQLLVDASRSDPAFPMHSRAVEVLERIGRPAARAVLQSLSGGAPGHPLTEQALAALRRMKS